MLIANQVTDDDLIGMPASPLWLARDSSVALGLPGTLRKALCQAHKFSTETGSPTLIVKIPTAGLRIPGAQIHRLWNRIRLP